MGALFMSMFTVIVYSKGSLSGGLKMWIVNARLS
jgi:hypothetical protein